MPKQIPEKITAKLLRSTEDGNLVAHGIAALNQLIDWAHSVEQRLELKEPTVKEMIDDVENQFTKTPRWRAELNHEYWYVNDQGEVIANYDYNRMCDYFRYNTGNYFKTKELAQEHRARILFS